MHTDGPLLFALGASRDPGAAIAAKLGWELAPHEEREFEDGEHKARPLVSVRGRDVYAIHSLHGEPGQSVNDKLLRLLFFVGALRDASAARVTAVVPYLAYSRKDQKSKSRDPVTTRYVASFFEAAGADCVVTLDVHNLAAFQNAYRCRAENLESAAILAGRLAPMIGPAEACVVSPDAGGIKRADRFRACVEEIAGRPVGTAFVEKYRSEGELRGDRLVGDVQGKVAILVDDLIASGRTLERAADACRRNGAARVLAAAAHGLFCGDAAAALAAGALERIVVTDTVPGTRLEAALAARVDYVSTAALFSQAIWRLHTGGSLSELR
ncbi:MAG TPA: ribose-phosphate diphosphokinase [Usitatibacter sp.]|nr:ribose-phosphate diphosphokinase [Usitatibacter sp.]